MRTDTYQVLKGYGLNPEKYQIIPFGSGLINDTLKIIGAGDSFILQRINTNVFKTPQHIADNLQLVGEHLKQTASSYLFAAPLQAINGDTLVELNGKHYRLSPFIEKSHTVNFLTDSRQAYEAAKQFGKFAGLLNGLDVHRLKYPLPDFHNLGLRVKQFNTALARTNTNLIEQAKTEIRLVQQFKDIANTYRHIRQERAVPLRIIHHDTKINNVLFDNNDNGLCVIDLDTVMPGYYISDVGDMMRTYLAGASEEEQDLDKIIIRDEFFEAICKGYMEEMGSVLTAYEKSLFIYSGKFMIYMQALRFLTDFLNGDIYYQTQYPGHNLLRAKNQLWLLILYCKKEEVFKRIILSGNYN